MNLHLEQLKAGIKAELLNVIVDLKDDPNYSKESAADELLQLIYKIDL
jgi:hypothetical protein